MTHKINKKRSAFSMALSMALIAGLFFVFACETEPDAYVNPETAFIMNGQLVQPQEILNDVPGESDNIVRVEIDGTEHYLKPELSAENAYGTSVLTIDEAKKRYADLAFGEAVQKVILIEAQKSKTVDEGEVFIVVESMPAFPGGEDSLMSYLRNTIGYPVIAQENGIQGRVFVQFVIQKDGVIRDAIVVRGVDPSLDAEALRVINAMPTWKPGTQRGKNVNVQFMIPINFALQNNSPSVVFGDFTVKNTTMTAKTKFTQDKKTNIRFAKGHVTDENGENLQGVSVICVDPNARISNGTVSDINGNFSLELKEGSTKIKMSFVGMETLTASVPPPPPPLTEHN